MMPRTGRFLETRGRPPCEIILTGAIHVYFMFRPACQRGSRRTALFVIMATLACAAVHASPAAAPPPSMQQQLDLAEHIKSDDNAKFQTILHRLARDQAKLTQHQQHQLAYLEAWQASHAGHLDRSTRMLKDLVEEADDPDTVTRARILLVQNDMIGRHYVEAFTLANSLMAGLEKISDPELRIQIFQHVISILNWQKQYEDALKYAKQMKALASTPRQRCQAETLETQTLLYRGGTLTSSSPRFPRTIKLCLDAGLLGYADALRLDWADQMNEEGHPAQALDLLKRITPDILNNGFQMHIASLHVTRAQAYLIQHKYVPAIRAAQAALAANDPGSVNWVMQAAYEVLYQAQQHTGDLKGALASFKQYLAQYKASSDDAKAQALAYQMVKQHVLAKRLNLQALQRQNRILQLRQSLQAKSAETSHLLFLLLLLVLASIVFWAFRTKYSQLRFRRMARHDDLTGIFNRQHFLERAEQTLKRLRKDDGHACLLILDMDHFKRINDAYGHVAGDRVLKQVAANCREQLRDSDVCGRLGGEEFGVLMPGSTVDQGMEISERIRMSLARSPVNVRDSQHIIMTVSIGLASTETHGYALRPLLLAADDALYAAKRGGRNRVIRQPASVPPTN